MYSYAVKLHVLWSMLGSVCSRGPIFLFHSNICMQSFLVTSSPSTERLSRIQFKHESRSSRTYYLSVYVSTQNGIKLFPGLLMQWSSHAALCCASSLNRGGWASSVLPRLPHSNRDCFGGAGTRVNTCLLISLFLLLVKYLLVVVGELSKYLCFKGSWQQLCSCIAERATRWSPTNHCTQSDRFSPNGASTNMLMYPHTHTHTMVLCVSVK